MKIFISTDFEGTSGIVSWEQVLEGNPEYAHGRALLTAEVNAAIMGALAGGATEFVVNDAHHQMRNLRVDELEGEATLISGRHKPLYMMQGLDSSFNAVFLVSYHGSISHETAILSHTYSPSAIYEVRLNGQVVGEGGINALVAAHYGVPVVLVTGDAATAEESKYFAPQAEHVVVKESISRFAASNLHPSTARRLIHLGAQRAVEGIASAPAPAITLPARLEIEFLTADMAEMAAWIEGAERTGRRTITLNDENALSLYKRFVTIIYLVRGLAE